MDRQTRANQIPTPLKFGVYKCSNIDNYEYIWNPLLDTDNDISMHIKNTDILLVDIDTLSYYFCDFMHVTGDTGI